MAKRKKKGFFRFGRNPLKIWQAWVGALLFLFIPIPLAGNISLGLLNWQCILAPLSDGFSLITNFNSLMGIGLLLSGFFFGAALKKGRDNFFQYGVGFLIVAIVLFFFVNSSIPLV